ncbi:unnamed protein product [Paramecium pentaurelia]|uniref:Uncharacterized protein n=1 Tax=Paramecium pentaurelia TaxID=43138 RepID=A0A8S1WFV8_9CILI|nr:unnamed protein product [Paramecium pentaurelia]
MKAQNIQNLPTKVTQLIIVILEPPYNKFVMKRGINLLLEIICININYNERNDFFMNWPSWPLNRKFALQLFYLEYNIQLDGTVPTDRILEGLNSQIDSLFSLSQYGSLFQELFSLMKIQQQQTL